MNGLLQHIPFWNFRKLYYKLFGLKIGADSLIEMSNSVINPAGIKIGKGSHVNRLCILDGRGGITIGNSVSISCKVNIITGTHEVNSSCFRYNPRCIDIEDFVWIGIGATILPGVKLAKGTVVCAGAVVTKNTEPYSVVAGIPAKKIAERNSDLNYSCKVRGLFK